MNAARICPCCGQPLPPEQEEWERIRAALGKPTGKVWPKTGQPIHRTIYEGADGQSYAVTYGGPQVSALAVKRAVTLGLLVPAYPEAPKVREWKLRDA